MPYRISSPALLVCGLASVLFTGCVSGPKTFHASSGKAETVLCSLSSVPEGCTDAAQIVQGKPNQFVDGVGWVLGIPHKLILWNSRVDNHNVQPETLSDVATFAQVNQLDGVCVRVNQYAPLDEWDRLRANKRVSPGWRYTLGTLSLVGYTLIPGRLFGGDQYNPYTDSVYVYSDVPALAMEATAYAKDVRTRRYPGTYAAVNQLPVVSIWHETVNTQDTLAYLKSNGTVQEQKDGLKILHPNYGIDVGTAISSGSAMPLAFAVVGHITGRVEASRLPTSESDAVRLSTHESERGSSVRMVNHEDNDVAER